MKKFYDWSRYIPRGKEREMVEDDEIDNNFIDPRRSRFKIKQLAKERTKYSRNELLDKLDGVPTYKQLKIKFKKLYPE